MAWVLNDPPPRYGEELAECQRMVINLTQGADAYKEFAVGFANIASPNTLKVIVPLPIGMRSRPTPIVIGAIGNLQLYNSETNYAAVTGITVDEAFPNAVILHFKAPKTLSINTPYWVRLTNVATQLLLSSEL